MPSRTRLMFIAAGLLVCVGVIIFHSVLRPPLIVTQHSRTQPYTVDERVQRYGEVVRGRLEPYFHQAGVPYPPKSLAFIGLKQQKSLEVYASGRNEQFVFVRAYPILAASGHAGPKLREGDLQVPEGLYRIESLNPNSLYHLALRVNYPNNFDRAQAALEHRTNLGGDIMIHGSNGSVGCLAMGDQTAEDLFVLVALTGIKNIQVVLTPVDMRVQGMPTISPDAPSWMAGVYEQIENELKKYPVSHSK